MATPTINPDMSDPPPDSGGAPGSEVGRGDDDASAQLHRTVEILSVLRVLLAELQSRLPPDG